jgi:hypothetical protein
MLIEELLAALRVSLLDRRAPISTQVERVRSLLDAYMEVVDAELAGELASRHGLGTASTGPSAAMVLVELRAAVAALPAVVSTSSTASNGTAARNGSAAHASAPPKEIGLSEPEAPATAPPPSASASSAPLDPEPSAAAPVLPAPVIDPPVRKSPSEPPDVAELVADWDALDPRSMSDAVFRSYAEEFAARARGLQERGVGGLAGQASISRLIRRITRQVSDRGVYVFGLALSHTANWTQVAERARRDRERLTYSETKPLTQKLVIPPGEPDED